MKPKRRKFLETVLRLMASAVLKKYKPIIVGITGSVGKSSTKEAVALVLKSKFSVRTNAENYNNEIGIPLTIIGAKSGKRSLLGWAVVLWRWLWLMLWRVSYPEILVLEMAIDRPGDMTYLLSFIPVKIGVLTDVSGSHLEYFKKVERIAKEKGKLITTLPKDGTAVLCVDNPLVATFLHKTKAKVISYGRVSEEAVVRAEHITLGERGADGGLIFKLVYQGKSLPVRLPKSVADHHVPAVLAALSVGLAFKLSLVDMVASVRDFHSLPGRMNVLSGIKRTTVIDDTYNASPVSLQAALKTLSLIPGSKKIAVLGDMLELGDNETEVHRSIAHWIKECGVDAAYLVGRRMLVVYEALPDKEKKYWFDNPTSAGAAVCETLEEGDIVLVKGSQGMRMEKAVELLLSHPEDTSKLLCRQSPDWKKKPFVQP